MSVRGFLELPDGMAARIDHAGLLIGRHRSCDIQLTAETASRRHALLRLLDDGVELIVLGTTPIEVNDKRCAQTQRLVTGDRIRMPGLDARIRIEQGVESSPRVFGIRRGADRIAIHAPRFAIGGTPASQLVMPGWPADALVFTVTSDVLCLVVRDAVVIDDLELAEAASIEVAAGTTIRYRGETLHVEELTGGDATTVDGARMAPTAVELAVLPRGGRATFRFPDADRTLYLPGRRFQLVSVLAREKGDWIGDSDLIPAVWDDTDEVGDRTAINVLMARCRHDLVAAGVAVAIERAPGGRATRIVLAPGAEVTEGAG